MIRWTPDLINTMEALDYPMPETAARALLNARDIHDHACTKMVNSKRHGHQRRRIALMAYAMPILERDVMDEKRRWVKEQLTKNFKPF